MLYPGHGEYCEEIKALLLLEPILDTSINYDSGHFFPVALHKCPEGLCYTYGSVRLTHLCIFTKGYVMTKSNVFGEAVEVISAE